MSRIIRIEVKPVVTRSPQFLDARARLTNQGDEPAYNVETELQVDGERFSSAMVDALPPGAGSQSAFHIPWEEKLPGRYFALFLVRYTDRNQFPFSAPWVFPFTWKAAHPSEIFLSLKTLALEQFGNLELTLQNLSENSLDAKLEFLFPKEIAFIDAPKYVTLSPLEKRKVWVKLENKLATSESVYPVFVVAQYDRGGFRYGTFAGANVAVVQRNFYQRHAIVLILGIVVFAALGLFQSIRKT